MKIETTKKLFQKEKCHITDYTPNADPIINAYELKAHNVLQVDGGGIRGVLPAYQTYVLELAAGKLNERFKIMWGTSTGAIITAMLAKGVSAKEIIRHYVEEGVNIFESSSVFYDFKSKYKNDFLVSTLKNYLEDITFQELFEETGVTLNIAVVNATTYAEEIWNPTTKPNEPVRTAVLASTSAPTYFPPVKNKGSYLIDGGTGVNNSTLRRGVNDILFVQKIPVENAFILSLGCGRYAKKYAYKGKLSQALWVFSFGREQTIIQQEKEFEYRKKDYNIQGKRWNIDLSKDMSAMDKTDNINELVALVDKHS